MTKASEAPSEEARMQRLWALLRSTTDSHERVVTRFPEDEKMRRALARLREVAARTYDKADDLSVALFDAVRRD